VTQQDHSHDGAPDHGHDHPHPEISQSGRPGYYDVMETAVCELLVERHLIGPDEIRRQIEVLDSRTQTSDGCLVQVGSNAAPESLSIRSLRCAIERW
jgi:hypothetical protein